MKRNESKSSISSASSYREIGKFWETHDLADCWDATRDTSFDVEISSEVVYCALDKMLSEKVRSAARKRGVARGTVRRLGVRRLDAAFFRRGLTRRATVLSVADHRSRQQTEMSDESNFGVVLPMGFKEFKSKKTEQDVDGIRYSIVDHFSVNGQRGCTVTVETPSGFDKTSGDDPEVFVDGVIEALLARVKGKLTWRGKMGRLQGGHYFKEIGMKILKPDKYVYAGIRVIPSMRNLVRVGYTTFDQDELESEFIGRYFDSFRFLDKSNVW